MYVLKTQDVQRFACRCESAWRPGMLGPFSHAKELRVDSMLGTEAEELRQKVKV